MRRCALTTCLLLQCALLLTQRAHAEEADVPPLEQLGEEAYKAILRFYEYNRDLPLEVRIVEKKEYPQGVREKFVFRGTRGFLVPGYLEIPSEAPEPYPCVLLLHGWSGAKDRWWRDGGYISGGEARKALLASGYAVLALDAPAHGDRIAENAYALVNDYVEEGVPTHRNFFALEEICAQSVVDYRRALDYLGTRAEIDTCRVGLLGYSMGGWQSFPLTAVDKRIKVAVACATPSRPDKFNILASQNYVRGLDRRP